MPGRVAAQGQRERLLSQGEGGGRTRVMAQTPSRRHSCPLSYRQHLCGLILRTAWGGTECCGPVFRKVKSLPTVTQLSSPSPGPGYQLRFRARSWYPGRGMGRWLTYADVLVGVIDEPLVDLVTDAQHIVLPAQAGHQLQLHLGEHLWDQGGAGVQQGPAQRWQVATPATRGFPAPSHRSQHPDLTQ